MSLIERVSNLFRELRRAPRAHAALLAAAVAGSAFVFYYALVRTRAEQGRVLSMASYGTLIRRLILTRGGELASKIMPLGRGAKTIMMPQDGVSFVVTVLDPNTEATKKASNVLGDSTSVPAAPVDVLEHAAKEFFVADLPPSHTLFFNKFPVVKNAAVITTKVFERQEGPLSLADMNALWMMVKGVGGLGFYNSGPQSGASQIRRHMQFMSFADFFQSLPAEVQAVLPEGTLPVDAAFAAAAARSAPPGAYFSLPAYSAFPHAACWIGDVLDDKESTVAATLLHGWYLALLARAEYEKDRRRAVVASVSGGSVRPASASSAAKVAAGASPAAAVPLLPGEALLPQTHGTAPHLHDVAHGSEAPSHNLIITPRWMAVVPRSRATWAGFSVNSVGFAGLILARSEQLGALRELTPLGLLSKVVSAPLADL